LVHPGIAGFQHHANVGRQPGCDERPIPSPEVSFEIVP
jgi:hypothetical protein